jgi:hypothetical protein
MILADANLPAKDGEEKHSGQSSKSNEKEKHAMS